FLTMVSEGTFDNDVATLKTQSEIINRDLNRLITLVNNLLDLERLDAGKLAIEPKDTLLSTCVNHALSAVSAMIQAKQLKVQTIIPENAAVHADENRLFQILVNLLSNAAKFSPAESEIKITATRQQEFWRIEVADQGPGLPSEFVQRAFNRFEQASLDH